MYRGKNSLPTYRHHRASGQAVVTLCGKDVYLGPHGTKLSRDNYDRVVAEWLAAGRSLPRPARDDVAITVAELVNAFRKSPEPTGNHAHDWKVVMILLVRLYGRTPAQDFGPIALKAVREQMIKERWNRKTINGRFYSRPLSRRRTPLVPLRSRSSSVPASCSTARPASHDTTITPPRSSCPPRPRPPRCFANSDSSPRRC
jgi:hypothetical protein